VSQPDLADKKKLKRSEIYRLIWRHTARDLGKALGCAEVLVHRASKLWNIPRPDAAARGKFQWGRDAPRTNVPITKAADDPIIFHHDGKRFRMSGLVKPRIPREKPKSGMDLFLEENRRREEEREAKRRALEAIRVKEFFDLRIRSRDMSYGLHARTTWRMFKEPSEPRQTLELTLRCEVLSPRRFRGRVFPLRLQ